jgi:glycosyltransferase involved in cell wall biosynthesis
MNKSLSVIIPCRNEEKYIRTCLDSIINNSFPKDQLEVFVIDGMSSDNTLAILNEYKKKYEFIFLLENKYKTVPYALNIGIKKSTGKYLIRLDVHSEYPENYFSELVAWSEKLNADNLGTLIITEVKNKNEKSNAIKKVLSAKLGVGNSYFRIGTKEIREVDTVPFGCFKRDIFDKVGLFDHRLARNQDIELNKRIKRNKGKIYLLSSLASTYYARESLWAIAKNNFATGYWNVLTIYITKQLNSLSLRHFVPLIFILSLVLPTLAMIWAPIVGYISLTCLLVYSFTMIIQSFKLMDKTTTIGYIFLSFLTLHFSYGFGSLLGLFRIDYLFKK